MDWENPNDPKYWEKWASITPEQERASLDRIMEAYREEHSRGLHALATLFDKTRGFPRKCATETRLPFVEQLTTHVEETEQNCGEE